MFIILYRFCEDHEFAKPNDIRGIKLMLLAALHVVETFNEIFLAYGQSDEFSFAFRRDAKIYNRRSEKILTCKNNLFYNEDLVSAFTSAYLFNWDKIFGNYKLKYPPSFDGRVVLYPSLKNLKDYFSWRMVDCHINNLYNTTFWALVNQAGDTKEQANNRLKGTFAKDKHEILFKDFNINYNNIEEIYKKGTLLIKEFNQEPKNKKKEDEVCQIETKDLSNNQIDELLIKDENYCKLIQKYYEQKIFISHEDVINDSFWTKFNVDL